MSDETKEEIFTITTGFGARTQVPFVNITVGAKDFHTQMSPETAIEIAHNLLHAAEAAMTDAFLITFLRERVGIEDKSMVGILNEFREWREKMEKGEKP